MGLLARVHQVVLLQVGELREGLGADVALERTLARVCAQVHLQVGQLAKGLAADVALVVHLPIALLQRVRQTAVAPATHRPGTHRTATARARATIRAQAARRRH